MDEHLEELSIEHDEREDDDDQPVLSQRELVRASLLRCPPSPPDNQPRR